MKINLLIMGLIALSLLSCNNKTKTKEKPHIAKKIEIRIATTDGSHDVFAYLTRRLLTEKGYHISIIKVKDGIEAIKDNQADIYLSQWVPINSNREVDSLVDLGNIYDDAFYGLVVPKYMKINSISELPTIKEKLKGEIYSIKSRKKVYSYLETTIKAYNLPYKPAELTVEMFEDFYMKRNDFCYTGMYPHPMLNTNFLKFLDDPKSVGARFNIVKYGTTSWCDSFPEIKKQIASIKLNTKDYNMLVEEMGKNNWEYKKSIDSWYQRVKKNFK
ncbi:hypothetical protein K5X82_11740 [Halosquirtibacter xylanolyticus]|uniref:glycine betaine ABC transporter substrate-binding protein n=1 Tax=Halosquirtibacter xylanolyticus TaxID=3374599 RepID=UPI0037488EFD|nr:hypothetical protein K5X82_11740 [Prolixibacteraceae bacterium]